MRSVIWAAAVALAAAAASPAMAQDEPPAVTPQDSAWHNRQVLAIVGLKAADGWGTLKGNVRWRRIAGNGSGKHPTATDTVKIHYTGRFIDGTTFDTSVGGPAAVFPLPRLIEAWQLAVPLAGVGDTIEIAVPADMGYGPEGRGPIPGNATLIFTIELLGIGAAQ